MNEKQIEAGKEVFMKFVAVDGLKSEWDGMSAYAVVEAILKASEKIRVVEEMLNSRSPEADESPADYDMGDAEFNRELEETKWF